MCGILGMAFQKGHSMNDGDEVKEILKRLLVESEARGSHATGCAFVDLSTAMVIKHNIPSKRFVDTDYYKNAVDKRILMESPAVEPTIILGHTRFKTKGTPTNTHNNHPILTDKVVGVHNGVISNDEALFDMYTLKRKAKVDSEVIFRLIEHHLADGLEMEDAIRETSKVLLGGYACAAVRLATPWVLWLFRHSGPIEVHRYPARGLILFASSEKFLEKAVDGFDLGSVAKMDIQNDEGLGMNMLQNRQVIFKIGEGSQKLQVGNG